MVNPYIAGPRTIAATITTAGTVTAGKHTPVDATAGTVPVALPTIPPGFAGAHLSVEKADNTANLVTITGNIRGATSTINLGYYRETIEFHTDATGAWFPTANHLPKSSVDGIVAALLAAGTGATATQLSATYLTFDGTNVLLAGNVIPISGGGGGSSAADNGLGGINFSSGATDNGLGGIAA